MAFITPGRAAGRAGGGEEETQVSQQPKPGCTGKLRYHSDPNRNLCPGYPDLLQLAGTAGVHVAEETVGSASFSDHRELGEQLQVKLSKPRLARPQWEASDQDLIPQMSKLVLWSQSERLNFHIQMDIPDPSTADSSTHLSTRK